VILFQFSVQNSDRWYSSHKWSLCAKALIPGSLLSGHAFILNLSPKVLTPNKEKKKKKALLNSPTGQIDNLMDSFLFFLTESFIDTHNISFFLKYCVLLGFLLHFPSFSVLFPCLLHFWLHIPIKYQFYFSSSDLFSKLKYYS